MPRLDPEVRPVATEAVSHHIQDLDGWSLGLLWRVLSELESLAEKADANMCKELRSCPWKG